MRVLSRQKIVSELKKLGWIKKRKYWAPPANRAYAGMIKALKDNRLGGLSFRLAAGIEGMKYGDFLE